MKKLIKKPIKIAFTGSYETGKTLMAKLLFDFLVKKKYKVEFIEELTRKFIPINKINKDTTFLKQKWILLKQIAKEAEAEFKKPDFILCNRSILDNYVYLWHSLEKHNRLLFNMVFNYLPTYDFLFYLPLRQKILNRVRNINPYFQKIIDKKLLYLIKKFKIKVIKVNSFGEVIFTLGLI